MNTDLNSASTDVVETNSLREILLFCTVLLVEIYGLAAAFGGPFFEVGYFLLVVISQTFAGAYIWAQLRQSDKTLPLPELLAMGFAIGSASAAISQLIIRDLLGIRLFLSPLVPIIGVAIWLLAKRNPRLPVTITHANTNTLLWLLFPAPLAMSFLIWQLNLFFIVPLGLFAYITKNLKIRSFFGLLIVIGSLSAIFSFVFKTMQKNSIALSLIGYDELFDEAMAIGFSNWGLGEHIGQAGSSFAYYKLSHVWLAPILELSHSSPMIISTSIMPLIVFMFIGISMWAASYQIFRSSTPAGIASVLFFLQSSLPEPDNLAIRVAQCLVIVYLLTGLIALMKAWNCIFQESLVVLFVFFVLISTRLQFGIIVLSGFLLFKILLFFRSKLSFRRSVLVIAAVVLSLVSSFFIFFNEPAHVVGTPNQNSNFALIGLLISFVGVRSIIPLLVIKRDNNQLDFLIVIIVSSVIIFFLIPLSILSTSPSLTIALLVSVLISNDIRKIKDSLTKVVSVSIFVLFSTLGFLLRLFYDLFKWVDSADIGILLKPFVIVATDGNYLVLFATAPFVVLTVLVLVSLRITRQQFRWRPIVLLTALSMSFGISVAATYRSVTNHYRYGMDLADKIEPNSPMAWYVDTDRLDALKWMRENTHRDEIFGQNTSRPDYWDTAYSASLILSGSIHRRAFIESTYLGELQREFPRHVSHQTDRQRKELLRFNTSFRFPITPNETMLKILQSYKVKWFVVDLGNTELRDWEPWATTRFMNEKVAILELAQGPVPSD